MNTAYGTSPSLALMNAAQVVLFFLLVCIFYLSVLVQFYNPSVIIIIFIAFNFSKCLAGTCHTHQLNHDTPSMNIIIMILYSNWKSM